MSYRLTVVLLATMDSFGRVTRYEKAEDPRRAECDQELPHPFFSNIRHPVLASGSGMLRAPRLPRISHIVIPDSREFRGKYVT